MINRELIRIKVIHVIYSYYQQGDNQLDHAEKELLKSMSRAYDLYNCLLQLIVEVHRMAMRTYETELSRYQRIHEGEAPSSKFADNLFANQLGSNRQLRQYAESSNPWANDEDFIRRIYKRVVESTAYQEYMADDNVVDKAAAYERDREVWRRLYKQVFMKYDDLDDVLEEKDLYWNDDRFIIDTFVLKTINRFSVRSSIGQELMPEYRDMEDLDFAKLLLRASLLTESTAHSLISQFLRNWDLNRLAFMDLIIMQTALAEMLTFQQIPISVTINEYVDIAKAYSTPQSGRYVNGLLDAIARHLIQTGRLQKEMAPASKSAPVDTADESMPDAAVSDASDEVPLTPVQP